MTRIPRTLVAALLLITGSAAAVAPRTFRLTTYKDFEEGDSEGVLLSSLGEVASGYTATRTDLAATQVFSSATARDGTVYLGTGDQAEVYAFDGKAVRKLCKLEGVLVSALVAADDGTVYAGTLPGGRLWTVRGGDKPTCSELARLDGADQVWALALPPGKPRLLAATGPSGKLFSVELPSGKNRVVWESGERHLLSMVPAEGGGLLIGTADEGILYHVGEDGSARALHDFAGDEVRAIVRAGDRIYVAVNESDRSKGAPAPPPGAKATGTKIVLPAAPASPPSPQPPGRDRKGKGAVFRLDPDGRVEQVHATSDGFFTALGVDPRGNVLCSAGSSGRVYLLRPDRTVMTVFSLAERQVLTLALGGPHPVLGTGDSGALYALDFTPAKHGRWVSKVLDAAFPARWGAVRFTASGPVTIETRSGNTARPDKAWSEWQALAEVAPGEAGGQHGKARSPGTRYLQLRASLGAEARLLDVAAWYAPQNQRARVSEVTVGEEPASGVARAGRVAGKPRSPVVKVRWKVENPDEDELVFRLAYRLESETNWKPLGGPDPLTAKEWDWNTESIPDGKYLVRVVASDERANPRDEALDFELVSSPWLIDNRRPEVSLKVAGLAVSGSARDSFTPIAEMAYAIDGGEFVPLGARDRLLDDLTEEFAFKLPEGLATGAHSVTVRAIDAADNVGLGQATFQVGK